MMKKKVIINSRNAYSTVSNYGNIQYAIDWSFLEEGKKYNLSFTFYSEGISVNNLGTREAYFVSIPLTGSALSFSSGSIISKQSNNVIGIITSQTYSSTNYRYIASCVDNPSFTIENRPSNNIFTVSVLNYSGSIVNINSDYVLTLTFEEI